MNFYQLRGNKIVYQGGVDYIASVSKRGEPVWGKFENLQIDSKGGIHCYSEKSALQYCFKKDVLKINKFGKICYAVQGKTDNFVARNYITLKKDLVVRTGVGANKKKKIIKRGKKFKVLKATTTGKVLRYNEPHWIYIKTNDKISGWVYINNKFEMVDNNKMPEYSEAYFEGTIMY